MRPLAQRIADAGYRVLVHDRRNCGLSDIVIGGEASEYETWADDLYDLLSQLKALPVVVGGSSSGCRLSLLFALKYPQAVRALLLWRVTGGAFAAARLTENYYDKYIRAAQGGMAAVCALDHFQERIAARPQNRAVLMAMEPETFIAAMERWREQFAKGAELPIIGASERDLNSIKGPTCIIPGNDKTHNHATAAAAHRMINGSELYDLFPGDLDIDLVPAEDWAPKEPEMAKVFVDFLARRRPRRPDDAMQRKHPSHPHHPYREPAAAAAGGGAAAAEQKHPGAKAAETRGCGARRRRRGGAQAGRLRARRDQRRRAGPHRLHHAREGPPRRLRRPELAAARHRRARFSPSSRRCSPTSPRRSSTGRPARARSAWKDFAALEADIARARSAMAGPARGAFMTSPSPGQIARYLKNQHYPTDEGLSLRARRRDGARVPRHRRGRLRAAARLPRPGAEPPHGVRASEPRGVPQGDRHPRRGAQPRGQGHPARAHAHAHLLGVDPGPAPQGRAAQGHRRHRAQGPAAGGVVPAPIRATGTSGRSGRT